MGPTLLTVSWILVSFAGISLSLRVYCKLASRRGLWWDDWILIIAWAVLLINAALASHMVRRFTFGRHSWDFNPPSVDKYSLVSLARVTFTIVSIAWSKAAFSVTLLRITDGWMKMVIWGIILSMNTFMGLGGLFLRVECKPLRKVWTPSMQGGTCWDPNALIGYSIYAVVCMHSYAIIRRSQPDDVEAYSVATGFVLAFLPWRILHGLRMNFKEKIGIVIAMGMGVIGGIAGIVKTVKLSNIASPDSYHRADLAIWDIAEAALVVIATCIPVLRIFLREVGDNTYWQYDGRRSGVNMQHIDVARVLSVEKGGVKKAASFGELVRGDGRSYHNAKSVLGGTVYVPAGRILRVEEVDVDVCTTNNPSGDIERQTSFPGGLGSLRSIRALSLARGNTRVGTKPAKVWTHL